MPARGARRSVPTGPPRVDPVCTTLDGEAQVDLWTSCEFAVKVRGLRLRTEGSGRQRQAPPPMPGRRTGRHSSPTLRCPLDPTRANSDEILISFQADRKALALSSLADGRHGKGRDDESPAAPRAPGPSEANPAPPPLEPEPGPARASHPIPCGGGAGLVPGGPRACGLPPLLPPRAPRSTPTRTRRPPPALRRRRSPSARLSLRIALQGRPRAA